MKKIGSLGLVLLVGIVGLVFIAVGFYNSLVAKSQEIDNQWAQVETQYQRRFDLIPNLVNSVKGYLAQEQKVFGDIADARTKYGGAQTTDEKAQAASQLEGALGRLLVIVENYPQLKSNETVQNLMFELAGTENRISVERMRFNDLVKVYNTSIKKIPGNIFASLFGFKEKAYFQAQEGVEIAPKVEL